MFLWYTQFSLIYTKLSEIITTVLFACGDDAIGKFDRSTLPRLSLMDILFLGLSKLKTSLEAEITLLRCATGRTLVAVNMGKLV